MKRLVLLLVITSLIFQRCGDRLDRHQRIEKLGTPLKIEFYRHLEQGAFEYESTPAFVITEKEQLEAALSQIINAGEPEPMKGAGWDEIRIHYQDTIVNLRTDKAHIGFNSDGPFYHLPKNNFITNHRLDSTQVLSPVQEKTYANARFKNVTVQKTGNHQFLITGEGQIFEASFGWVVEDGHNELAKGFEMTDAGAPAWGKFKFTIEVEKQRPNSTLTLILFESSAMDGSRQYELPMVLP